MAKDDNRIVLLINKERQFTDTYVMRAVITIDGKQYKAKVYEYYDKNDDNYLSGKIVYVK